MSDPKKPHDKPELFTIREVARMMKGSEWAVYEAMRRGELGFSKIGKLTRFTRADIDLWLLRGHVKSNAELEAELEDFQKSLERRKT